MSGNFKFPFVLDNTCCEIISNDVGYDLKCDEFLFSTQFEQQSQQGQQGFGNQGFGNNNYTNQNQQQNYMNQNQGFGNQGAGNNNFGNQNQQQGFGNQGFGNNNQMNQNQQQGFGGNTSNNQSVDFNKSFGGDFQWDSFKNMKSDPNMVGNPYNPNQPQTGFGSNSIKNNTETTNQFAIGFSN